MGRRAHGDCCSGHGYSSHWITFESINQWHRQILDCAHVFFFFFLVKGESIEIIVFVRITNTLDFLGVMISEHGY